MSNRDALFFGAFPIMLGLISAVLLTFAFRVRKLQKASRTWPTAPGTVTDASIRQFRNPKGRHVFAPAIIYEYAVDGLTYSGDRISPGVSPDSSTARVPAGVQPYLDRYPVGVPVTVFYNPDDHSSCLLEPEGGGSVFGILLSVGLVFGIIGLCFGGSLIAAWLAD